MSNQAADIHARFKDEVQSIQSFISTTSEFILPTDVTVDEVHYELRRLGINDFYSRSPEHFGTPFRKKDFEELIAAMDITGPQIHGVIRELDGSLEAFPVSYAAENKMAPEHLNNANDWKDFFRENVDPAATKVVKQEWVDRACGQFLANLEGSETRTTEDEIREYLSHLMNCAFRESIEQKIIDLEEILATFERFRTAANMQDPNAAVNILRQGFLLLMTAFDAAVFDMVREARDTHFFKLMSRLAKKEAVPIKDWGMFSDDYEFRAKMIESSLKGYYLRELLEVLRGIDIRLVKHNEDTVKLIELILRRNLHVHNRGYVDERYIELNEQGKPKFNIFGLALGDMAEIHQPYFKEAIRLTTDCLSFIRDWCSAQPVPKAH